MNAPASAVTVNVVVPTRLRHRLLARAIGSLLDQTLPSLEILIVDDNSPASRIRTDPGLAGLLAHPRIRIFEHDNPRNAASARNVALRAATAEWITFLDDDDSYRPQKLQKQWERATHADLPLCMCGVAYHLARGVREVPLSRLEYGRDDLLLVFQALPGLFHRNTHGKVLFREDLDAGEDAYYFQQLVAHFHVNHICNVLEPLVDVYPQPGIRVNTNAEAAWKAAQVLHRDFATRYSDHVGEALLLRARLGYLKHQQNSFCQMLQVSRRLWQLRGNLDLRFILNALLQDAVVQALSGLVKSLRNATFAQCFHHLLLGTERPPVILVRPARR